jgi:hypothetical protein
MPIPFILPFAQYILIVYNSQALKDYKGQTPPEPVRKEDSCNQMGEVLG